MAVAVTVFDDDAIALGEKVGLDRAVVGPQVVVAVVALYAPLSAAGGLSS